MAKKILVALDFNKNEAQNLRTHNLASAPSTPALGQRYYDTTTNCEYYWNGAWIPCDAALRTGIPLTNLATDPLARANHTGTQTAATISDFNTAVRTNRLDQMAAPTAAVSMNSQKITGLATPTAASDAATKQYVDDTVASISWKNEVRAATTGNAALSTAYANGQTVDGVTLVTGDRILIKDQTTQSENGIYTVNASGAPTRATDADSDTDFKGAAVFVASGTTNGGTRWVCNVTGTIVLGTTALTFVQFGGGQTYTAGNGLTLSANDFNVGAGTGITVNANDVAVDTTVVVRKYATTFGDGAQNSYTITHNLNTQDVTVSVRQVSDNAFVECDVTANGVNTILLGFAAAVASNALRVVVHG